MHQNGGLIEDTVCFLHKAHFSSINPIFAAVYAIFISVLAVPVLYVLDEHVAHVREEIFLFAIGIVVCAAIFVLSYIFIFSRIDDAYVAWFTLFAFTGTIDLLLAFCIRGDIHVMDW